MFPVQPQKNIFAANDNSEQKTKYEEQYDELQRLFWNNKTNSTDKKIIKELLNIKELNFNPENYDAEKMAAWTEIWTGALGAMVTWATTMIGTGLGFAATGGNPAGAIAGGSAGFTAGVIGNVKIYKFYMEKAYSDSTDPQTKLLLSLVLYRHVVENILKKNAKDINLKDLREFINISKKRPTVK